MPGPGPEPHLLRSLRPPLSGRNSLGRRSTLPSLTLHHPGQTVPQPLLLPPLQPLLPQVEGSPRLLPTLAVAGPGDPGGHQTGVALQRSYRSPLLSNNNRVTHHNASPLLQGAVVSQPHRLLPRRLVARLVTSSPAPGVALLCHRGRGQGTGGLSGLGVALG